MKRIVLLPVLLAFQVGVQPALAWTWPVDGPVLQPFSLGEDPYAAGDHRGVDVAAAAGAPVRAPAGGSVTFAGTVPGGGRTVTIRTADGYSVTLLHLGSITTAESASVAEGEAVGTAGTSGEPEHAEPYVHLGVRVAADPEGYVDPETLLPPRAAPVPEPPPAAEPEREKAEARPAAPAVSVHTAVPGSPQAAPQARASGEPDRKTNAARARQARSARRPASILPPAAVGGVHRSERLWAAELSRHAIRKPATAVSASAPKPWLPSAWLSVGVVLAAAVLLLRRQFRDTGPADRSPAMLLELGSPPAEDTRCLRLGEHDRLVLERDLEGILLAEAETLPDFDRNDDAPELVQVSDDAGRHAACRAGRSSRGLSGAHRPPARPFAGAHA
jgi:hypothetical protein